MPDLADLLSIEFWRAHARAVAYCLWGFIAFVIFAASNFPYTQALSAAIAPLGIKATWSAEHSKLPAGVEIQKLRITSLSDPGAAPSFETESIGIMPALGSILLGRPGIRVRASLYGGDVSGTLRRAGNGIKAVFDARDINLAHYRGFAAWGVSFNGQVSASAAVSNANGLIDTTGGKIDLQGRSITIRPGFGFPDLSFADLKGNALIVNGILIIESLDGTGADGAIDMTGTVRLAPDLGASILNLAIKITPSASGTTRLGFLMRLLPHPPGTQPYRVGGSIAQQIFS